LWDALAERLERNGREPSGRLPTGPLDRVERHALTNLLGRPVTTDRTPVDLSALDRRLRQRSGVGLVDAVEQVRGAPLVDRPAVRDLQFRRRDAPVLAAGRWLADHPDVDWPFMEAWLQDLRRGGILARDPDPARLVVLALEILWAGATSCTRRNAMAVAARRCPSNPWPAPSWPQERQTTLTPSTTTVGCRPSSYGPWSRERGPTCPPANDAPERDPKNFSVEGSLDGSTWTPIDTRTNQTFPKRQAGLDFSTKNTTAYTFYRLSISANVGSSGLTQLADWDIRDTRPGAAGMLAGIGSGPANGPTSKPSVGFSGTRALRFGGKHSGGGPASASDLLFDNAVTVDSELSYQVFPDYAGDLQYPSTWVAVDLVLDDGKTLSRTANLVDANGFGVSARAHGEQKLLFANQWNSVRIPLTALAGRTVTKVLLTYDNSAGNANTVFSGWLDDVRIGAAAPIDGSSLVNYVDTRRGTMSNSSYSRGSNIPAAAVPNGFNFFTPMTDASQQGTEYEYHRSNNDANVPTLQAIGISHEPSIWMGDRNQLAIMPSTSAKPTGDLRARGLPFNHSDETARPDLYGVKFTNDLVTEVTPTDHGGIYRFTFPGTTGSVVVDQVAGASSLSVAADGTVSGWVDGGSGASAGRSRMFVYGTFDTKPATVGQASGSRTSARYAGFHQGGRQRPASAGDLVHLARAGSQEPRPRGEREVLRSGTRCCGRGLEQPAWCHLRGGGQPEPAGHALLEPLPDEPLPELPVREHRLGGLPSVPVREPGGSPDG